MMSSSSPNFNFFIYILMKARLGEGGVVNGVFTNTSLSSCFHFMKLNFVLQSVYFVLIGRFLLSIILFAAKTFEKKQHMSNWGPASNTLNTHPLNYLVSNPFTGY
ncbi:UNVERIFIED_CONTAM: hypothetical protein GTU68_038379 [Idotea baltica]|nr:hypothetical protein [Idotea baltica]